MCLKKPGHKVAVFGSCPFSVFDGVHGELIDGVISVIGLRNIELLDVPRGRFPGESIPETIAT